MWSESEGISVNLKGESRRYPGWGEDESVLGQGMNV